MNLTHLQAQAVICEQGELPNASKKICQNLPTTFLNCIEYYKSTVSAQAVNACIQNGFEVGKSPFHRQLNI